MDAKYETNLAAFIKDIRSAEHGLGVPGLPVVIATSGMIETADSLIKQGQLAIGDRNKYPQFAGNFSVVDTVKPYGPEQMEFKFYTVKSPDKVGYHWNNHARSYFKIGRAMAAEMRKLGKPNPAEHSHPCGGRDHPGQGWRKRQLRAFPGRTRPQAVREQRQRCRQQSRHIVSK